VKKFLPQLEHFRNISVQTVGVEGDISFGREAIVGTRSGHGGTQASGAKVFPFGKLHIINIVRSDPAKI